MPGSRKAEAKLAARRAKYDAHGKNPNQNPSNSGGKGHDMHKPGSQNLKKG